MALRKKGHVDRKLSGGGGRRPSFPYCSGGPEKARNKFDLRLNIFNFLPNTRLKYFYDKRRQNRDGAIDPPVIFKTTKEPLFNIQMSFLDMKLPFFIIKTNCCWPHVPFLTPAPSNLTSV